ncbi:type I restriction endonuclease subunit S [Muribaculaceae bacterium Isolate-105 (HZI)]|nr:type I restriction endonuclease subunit S [Muribaculaceae bacterium Isolate-105 (HZI)]
MTQQGEPNTRISDCLECHTSTLQESNLQESGKYPVYGASGVAGHLDEYVCDKDSILIIKDGSGVGTVSRVSGKYSVIGTLNYLTAKPGYSLIYLYFCLRSFNFNLFKTGMAIPHIYFKDYERAKIWCPTLESQNDIAKILSAIEEKLQIESGILDSLHRKKSYLLNNMFI